MIYHKSAQHYFLLLDTDFNNIMFGKPLWRNFAECIMCL
jgi:hypothetical protein